MDIDLIVEQIRTEANKELASGNTSESNAQLQNGELLWAALALLGFAYSLERGTKEEHEAKQFWPFGEFKPSDTTQENLVRTCQMIIFEIDRLNNLKNVG